MKDLIDPKTGEYYAGVVNVTKSVNLFKNKLVRFPVQFGKVGGIFACSHNKLTTLEGAPREIGGSFDCTSNKLTSLEGAPREVGSIFSCDINKLTSLEGIHKIIKRINGVFFCHNNPITSGGIGLILIEGLTKFAADHPAFRIIEKYIGQGKKGLLLCQDELDEAGFEEFAKL